MTVSPQVCVVDTNVLIDLYTGGVSRAVFQLPILLLAPDVLIAELQEPDGKLLLSYGLSGCELSSDEVQKVFRLATQYRRVSVNDLFALELARTLGTVLLTGDKHLRRVADQEGVPVRGTLWLLDEMVRLAVIPPRLAAQALEHMLNRGRRLPSKECERRLRQWRGWLGKRDLRGL